MIHVVCVTVSFTFLLSLWCTVYSYFKRHSPEDGEAEVESLVNLQVTHHVCTGELFDCIAVAVYTSANVNFTHSCGSDPHVLNPCL